MVHFTITEETAAKLERRKEEIERDMARLREEHQRVMRQLEAIPLFLGEANGATAPNGHQSEPSAPRPAAPRTPPGAVTQPNLPDLPESRASIEEMSLPMKVKLALQQHGRMTALELRDALMKMGVDRERFGATYSYLYTVLGRLEHRGQIQKVRGKFQLPPGVTHQYRPDEDFLKS